MPHLLPGLCSPVMKRAVLARKYCDSHRTRSSGVMRKEVSHTDCVHERPPVFLSTRHTRGLTDDSTYYHERMSAACPESHLVERLGIDVLDVVDAEGRGGDEHGQEDHGRHVAHRQVRRPAERGRAGRQGGRQGKGKREDSVSHPRTPDHVREGGGWVDGRKAMAGTCLCVEVEVRGVTCGSAAASDAGSEWGTRPA